jgi:hypothetical protein
MAIAILKIHFKPFMNKKENENDILSVRTTIRFKAAEYKLVKERAEKAGISFANFCREMTTKGYVQAVQTTYNLNELRELKSLLIEYRTNFSRISNFIKMKDPALNVEVLNLKEEIQTIIDKVEL